MIVPVLTADGDYVWREGRQIAWREWTNYDEHKCHPKCLVCQCACTYCNPPRRRARR